MVLPLPTILSKLRPPSTPSKDSGIARHLVFRVVVALFIGANLLVEPVAGDPPNARLQLKTGEFIDGQFASVEAEGVLGWRSPAFSSPLEVDWKWVRSIDGLSGSVVFSDLHPFLFSFVDGTRLSGDLAGLNEKEIEIDTPVLGRLRFDRSLIRQMKRPAQGVKLAYEGPRSLEG